MISNHQCLFCFNDRPDPNLDRVLDENVFSGRNLQCGAPAWFWKYLKVFLKFWWKNLLHQKPATRCKSLVVEISKKNLKICWASFCQVKYGLFEKNMQTIFQKYAENVLASWNLHQSLPTTTATFTENLSKEMWNIENSSVQIFSSSKMHQPGQSQVAHYPSIVHRTALLSFGFNKVKTDLLSVGLWIPRLHYLRQMTPLFAKCPIYKFGKWSQRIGKLL